MIVKADTSSFKKEVLDSKTPVIVDFWAEWCAPCRIIAPSFEQLSKEMVGKLKFVKLNVDENNKLAAEHGIMSIPCLVMFKNGKEAGRIVGSMSAAMLKSRIQQLL